MLQGIIWNFQNRVIEPKKPYPCIGSITNHTGHDYGTEGYNRVYIDRWNKQKEDWVLFYFKWIMFDALSLYVFFFTVLPFALEKELELNFLSGLVSAVVLFCYIPCAPVFALLSLFTNSAFVCIIIPFLITFVVYNFIVSLK